MLLCVVCVFGTYGQRSPPTTCSQLAALGVSKRGAVQPWWSLVYVDVKEGPESVLRRCGCLMLACHDEHCSGTWFSVPSGDRWLSDAGRTTRMHCDVVVFHSFSDYVLSDVLVAVQLSKTQFSSSGRVR